MSYCKCINCLAWEEVPMTDAEKDEKVLRRGECALLPPTPIVTMYLGQKVSQQAMGSVIDIGGGQSMLPTSTYRFDGKVGLVRPIRTESDSCWSSPGSKDQKKG